MSVHNITAMRAQEAAYGQKLNTTTQFSIVSVYVLLFVSYSWLLTLRWVVGVIVGLMAYLIARYTIIPREINIRYYRRGLEQRHLFMNTITQVFGEGKQDVDIVAALKIAAKGCWGEFKQQIEQLIGTILEDNSGPESHAVFTRIRDKYSDDVWFDEFMEQLETTNESGHANTRAFHDICKNANELFSMQKRYISDRKAALKFNYTIMYAIVIALIIVFLFFGWQNYSRTYAHFWVSELFITPAFLIFNLVCLHMMYNYYYDESLTSK